VCKPALFLTVTVDTNIRCRVKFWLILPQRRSRPMPELMTKYTNYRFGNARKFVNNLSTMLHNECALSKLGIE
jgi:hypothetical protein